MVLAGGEYTINAKKDSIVLNAGFGCYVYGLTDTIEAGCALARKTLIEGKGEELLRRWVAASKEIAGRG
jgi:anthranilate phosphoribosyltransferase